MSEWSDGYRAALADVKALALGRVLVATGYPPPKALEMLLDDLAGDALVIEREQDNRIRRRRLAAVREATLPFDEAPP